MYGAQLLGKGMGTCTTTTKCETATAVTSCAMSVRIAGATSRVRRPPDGTYLFMPLYFYRLARYRLDEHFIQKNLACGLARLRCNRNTYHTNDEEKRK